MIYTTRVRVYGTRRDDVGYITNKRSRARGERERRWPLLYRYVRVSVAVSSPAA